MKFYMDKKKQLKKPNSTEIKRISSNILDNPVDLTPLELAMELGYGGKTVVLSELPDNAKLSKTTPIISQEIIMLDFDNKDKDIYNISDLLKDDFMINNACFYYRTFSDRDSLIDKFRVVFILDEIMDSNEDIEYIYQLLFNRYPMSDTTIGQTSRLFFGGNLGYKVINKDNKLDISTLEELATYKVNTKVSNVVNIDSPIYELFKHNKFVEIKEKWSMLFGESIKANFPDEYNALIYFRSLNIVEMLELPTENPFYDIFHKETSPSSSVFYSDDLNMYFYKCHSKSAEFTGDFIQVIKKLTGISNNAQVLKMLVKLTGSVIDGDSELGLLKLNSTIFRKNLLTGVLEKTHPELYSYIKRYREEIGATLDIMYDYLYIDIETGEIKYLNFYNLDTLRSKVSKILGRPIAPRKMWNVLNTIVVTEIIQKLDRNQIPVELYEKIILSQVEDERVRTSNFYTMSNLDDVGLLHNSEIVKVLMDNNVTVSSLSYEVIYRLFGEEKAKRDFPQAYQPLVEQNKIKMSLEDKNLTKKSTMLEKRAIKLINKELESNGYIYEQDLIKILARNSKTSINSTTRAYTKCRADIINKYGLERNRLTKDLANDLKIKDNYTPKTVIYKL